MKIQEIVVPTVAQEVYKELRNQMIKGEIPPGDKISIRMLAEAFGVSTMPIRESLTKLEAEGFVRIERRSIVVNKLSSKEVIEIFSIRKNLEKLATEWAFPNLSEESITKLEKLINEMDLNLNHPFEWRKVNKKFHFELYSYSNSKPLIELLSHLWGRIEPYMNIYSSEHYLSIAQEEHYKIIAYIRENELEALTTLITDHIQITCDAILKEMSD